MSETVGCGAKVACETAWFSLVGVGSIGDTDCNSCATIQPLSGVGSESWTAGGDETAGCNACCGATSQCGVLS